MNAEAMQASCDPLLQLYFVPLIYVYRIYTYIYVYCVYIQFVPFYPDKDQCLLSYFELASRAAALHRAMFPIKPKMHVSSLRLQCFCTIGPGVLMDNVGELHTPTSDHYHRGLARVGLVTGGPPLLAQIN